MKARRIAAQRIGTGNTAMPPLHKDRESMNLAWFGLLSAIVMVAAFILALWATQPDVVQPTMTAPITATITTLAPTATITPFPTVAVVPSATPVVVYGVALGDVWLRASPGGERLPAALLAGQRVIVLEESNGFLKVQWSKKDVILTGWVTAKWVEVQ